MERAARPVERQQQSARPASESHIQLPIKSEIRLKLSQGCGREDGSVSAKATGSTAKATADKSNHPVAKVGDSRPLSSSERESLCKHTGVCMSGPASGDLEDKAE